METSLAALFLITLFSADRVIDSLGDDLELVGRLFFFPCNLSIGLIGFTPASQMGFGCCHCLSHPTSPLFSWLAQGPRKLDKTYFFAESGLPRFSSYILKRIFSDQMTS